MMKAILKFIKIFSLVKVILLFSIFKISLGQSKYDIPRENVECYAGKFVNGSPEYCPAYTSKNSPYIKYTYEATCKYTEKVFDAEGNEGRKTHTGITNKMMRVVKRGAFDETNLGENLKEAAETDLFYILNDRSSSGAEEAQGFMSMCQKTKATGEVLSASDVEKANKKYTRALGVHDFAAFKKYDEETKPGVYENRKNETENQLNKSDFDFVSGNREKYRKENDEFLRLEREATEDQRNLQIAMDEASKNGGIVPDNSDTGYAGKSSRYLARKLDRSKKNLERDKRKYAKGVTKQMAKEQRSRERDLKKSYRKGVRDDHRELKGEIKKTKKEEMAQIDEDFRSDMKYGMKKARAKKKQSKKEARRRARQSRKDARKARLEALGRNHREEGQNQDEGVDYEIDPMSIDPKFCYNSDPSVKDMGKAQVTIESFMNNFDSADPQTCKILYGKKMFSGPRHPDFAELVQSSKNYSDPLGKRICAILKTDYPQCEDPLNEIESHTQQVENNVKAINKNTEEINKLVKYVNGGSGYDDWTEDEWRDVYNRYLEGPYCNRVQTTTTVNNVDNTSTETSTSQFSAQCLESARQDTYTRMKKRVDLLTKKNEELGLKNEELIKNDPRDTNGPSCSQIAIAEVYNTAVKACASAYATHQNFKAAGGNGGLGGEGNDNQKKDESGGPAGGGPSMITSWDGKYQCVWTETAADWKSCKRMITTYNSIFAGEQAMNTMHMVEGTKFRNNKSKEVQGETEKMQNGEGGDLQSKALDISQDSVELAAKQEERKMWVSTGAVTVLGGVLMAWVTPRNIRDNCEKYPDDCSNAGKQIEAHDQHFFPNFHMRGKFMMAIAEYGSKALASMMLKNRLKDQAAAIGKFKEDLDTLKDGDGENLMLTQCQVEPNHPNCRMDSGHMVRHSAYNPHGGREFSGGGTHQNFDSKQVDKLDSNSLGDYVDDNENYDAETLGKIGDVLGDGGGKKTGNGNRPPPAARVGTGSRGGGGGGGGGGASAQGTGGNFSAKGVADAKGGEGQSKLEVNRFERGKSKKGSKFAYHGGSKFSNRGRKNNRGDRTNPLDAFMGRKPAGKEGGTKVMNFGGKGSISQDRDSSIFARIKKRYKQAYESDRLLTHR